MSANHSARSGGIILVSFRFSLTLRYVVCTHGGESNVYTQNTIFNIKEDHPKLPQTCSYVFPQDTLERVRNNCGKRAVSVQGTEGVL